MLSSWSGASQSETWYNAATSSRYWKLTRAVSISWPRRQARWSTSSLMRARSLPQVRCCTGSTSNLERPQMMSSTDEQIDSLILSFVRRRLPDIDAADLARPIYDLDVDSLDVVDLTHELEAKFAVQADLDR